MIRRYNYQLKDKTQLGLWALEVLYSLKARERLLVEGSVPEEETFVPRMRTLKGGYSNGEFIEFMITIQFQ